MKEGKKTVKWVIMKKAVRPGGLNRTRNERGTNKVVEAVLIS